MKAQEIMVHFQEIGKWVNWDNTCDQFLYGEPEIEVSGIATAWIPTNAVLKKATEKGINLFITHEPEFCVKSRKIQVRHFFQQAQQIKIKRDLEIK